MSELKNIYKKIHEAKLEIGTVAKNATNPHFKNTYADLNALIEAVEPILLTKGLVLLQPVKDGKVFTIVIDVESAESLESFIDLPTGGTPQSMGSAITYYRRYTLQSLLSLQAVDDDGQHASKPVVTLPPCPDKAFSQAIDRITAGERSLVLALKDNYLLTTAQSVKLTEALNF